MKHFSLLADERGLVVRGRRRRRQERRVGLEQQLGRRRRRRDSGGRPRHGLDGVIGRDGRVRLRLDALVLAPPLRDGHLRAQNDGRHRGPAQSPDGGDEVAEEGDSAQN